MKGVQLLNGVRPIDVLNRHGSRLKDVLNRHGSRPKNVQCHHGKLHKDVVQGLHKQEVKVDLVAKRIKALTGNNRRNQNQIKLHLCECKSLPSSQVDLRMEPKKS